MLIPKFFPLQQERGCVPSSHPARNNGCLVTSVGFHEDNEVGTLRELARSYLARPSVQPSPNSRSLTTGKPPAP